MRLVFALLILALQYPMWLGKGGWLRVRELDGQVEAQKDVNAGLKARNAALDAEVRDLKQGFEAIEERARSELGMIRQDEVFFQLPAAAAPGRCRGVRAAADALVPLRSSGAPGARARACHRPMIRRHCLRLSCRVSALPTIRA